MLSLVTFIIVLGVLIFVHELGHFIAAKRTGVRVERFSLGFGPKIFSVKKGETEYVIASIPLGGYVKMAGDEPGETLTHEKWEYLSRSVFERFRIIFAGPFLNYCLGFLLFSIIFMFGSPTLTTEVGSLIKGYPAERDGLLVGDKIAAVDGKPVKFWQDMTEIIHKRVEGPIAFTIDRNGSLFEKRIQPVVRRMKDIFGKEVSIAQIGIGPSQRIENVRYPLPGAVRMGFKQLMQLTAVTYKALWSVLIGRLSLKDSVTGPIGMLIITGQVAKLGLIAVLNLMGLLSTSLAIFNMLPLPILDGGHIIFLFLEKLRGRPLSVRAQEVISNIGIALLVTLTVFVLYSDMSRFGIFEKMMGLFKK